ncbi:MAG: fasciclin domain-containing protein [Goleter apudmare HA4340-LM2]|jgi:uncharacterized surface protein with fasciclin (FAS1) repeats|nr:fasciclin domain-containing protein [Goleter apudmare HA4340-LM2]
MKVNYSQLLVNLAGIVGITSVGLLMTLPSGAKEATNPNPTIFSESPYNRGQRIAVKTQYAPAEPATEAVKGAIPSKNLLAQQNSSGKLNPRPSIFNEPPYNRRSNTETTEPAPTPTNTPESGRTPRPIETPETTVPTETPPAAGTTETQGKTLLALAESNSSFSVLTQAIKAAGLAETLQGKDNLTVFAPTDAAFAKLPQDAVRDLLKPENKEILVKLLTYHVVSGSVLSTDLKSGEVKSIEGGAINVKVEPTGVKVNEANVTQADIKGSNGVIHAIDQVILPPDL